MKTLGERLVQQGFEIGFEIGFAIGQRAVLLWQLAWRFGILPTEVVERVVTSDSADLERWTDRIFDATSLEQFFAESPNAGT